MIYGILCVQMKIVPTKFYAFEENCFMKFVKLCQNIKFKHFKHLF